MFMIRTLRKNKLLSIVCVCLYIYLLYASCYIPGFTMEIPIPNSVQYLCQYAQKTDFASCIVIGHHSNTSSFSFKIPRTRRRSWITTIQKTYSMEFLETECGVATGATCDITDSIVAS